MKRSLFVKIDDLPARSVQLSEDSMVNIFGGCQQENYFCDACGCCDGLTCEILRNKGGRTYYVFYKK